jgi:hypothetical protein
MRITMGTFPMRARIGMVMTIKGDAIARRHQKANPAAKNKPDPEKSK